VVELIEIDMLRRFYGVVDLSCLILRIKLE
jgi:hypothetical protein